MLLRLQGRIPGIGSNLCKIYSCLQILRKLLKQHASNYFFFFHFSVGNDLGANILKLPPGIATSALCWCM